MFKDGDKVVCVRTEEGNWYKVGDRLTIRGAAWVDAGQGWVANVYDGDVEHLQDLEVDYVWIVCEDFIKTDEDASLPVQVSSSSTWTDSHYGFDYTLTEEDKEVGAVRIDPYLVSNLWKLGTKDESGALFHCLKTIARFNTKNDIEREVRALYAQVLALARMKGVKL